MILYILFNLVQQIVAVSNSYLFTPKDLSEAAKLAPLFDRSIVSGYILLNIIVIAFFLLIIFKKNTKVWMGYFALLIVLYIHLLLTIITDVRNYLRVSGSDWASFIMHYWINFFFLLIGGNIFFLIFKRRILEEKNLISKKSLIMILVGILLYLAVFFYFIPHLRVPHWPT